jgi:hypothetical protein
MRLLFAILFGFGTVFTSGDLLAQQEATVTLDSVRSDAQFTYIYLSSDQPFIIGGNRYVLHIGDIYIARNNHPDGDESRLMFMAEKEVINSSNSGADAYLVYGLYDNNLSASYRKQNGMEGLHWNLGPLK